MDQVTKQIKVVVTSILDYEALHNPQFLLTVEVADNGVPSLHFNKTFLITITDINEPPTNITISSDKILETAKRGQVVGKLNAFNPEPNQTVIFAVQKTDDNSTDAQFDVWRNDTGSYLVLTQEPQDDWLGSYEIDLNVTDTGSPRPLVFASIRIYVVSTDPCSTGALKCDANAICRRYNSTYGVCRCNDGFTGSGAVCQQIDNCKVPSQNQGISITSGSSAPALAPTSICVGNSTCINRVNNFTCVCSRGYTGTFCENQIDLCTTQSEPFCLNGGSCYSTLGTLNCTCLTGFVGVKCEINQDDCSSNPCTRGTCVDGVDAYTCQCPEGYTGKDCSYLTDACVDSACSDTQICVPMAQTADGNNGNSVAIITPGEGGNLEPLTPAKYSCVPKADITFGYFDNVTIDADFRNSWKDLIKRTVYPDPDGSGAMVSPDDVYLLPGPVDGDGLGFVVLVGNNVMPPGVVLAAADKACKNATNLPKLAALCSKRKVTTLQPEERPPSPIEIPGVPPAKEQSKDASKSSTVDTTWLIVAAVVVSALVLIAIITARFTYIKRNRIKQWERLSDQGAINNGDLTPGNGEEQPFVQNPLYSNPYATITNREEPSAVRNPLYDAYRGEDAATAAPEVDGDEEPLYDQLNIGSERESSVNMWREADTSSAEI